MILGENEEESPSQRPGKPSAGVPVPPDLLEATPQPASQPVVCTAVSLTAFTNSSRGPPPPRPPPPRDLPLSTQKTLPRTNPYFASPKSPRSPEFGPFRQAELPHLPDVVHRPASSRISHSQSTFHLANDKPNKNSHHLSSINLHASSSTLPTKLSHSISHATLFKPESSSHPTPASPPKPISPQSPGFNSISSKRLSSLPPRALPSNPFLWPLSSLPPDDPSDEARRLGTELFTELLRSASRRPLNAPMSPPTTSIPSQSNLLNISTNSSSVGGSQSDVCFSAVSKSVDTMTNTVCLSNTNSTMTTTKTVDTNRAIPSDPLTTQKAPLGFGGPAAKGPAKPPEDKYSALAELDDLFKSTAIQGYIHFTTHTFEQLNMFNLIPIPQSPSSMTLFHHFRSPSPQFHPQQTSSRF